MSVYCQLLPTRVPLNLHFDVRYLILLLGILGVTFVLHSYKS